MDEIGFFVIYNLNLISFPKRRCEIMSVVEKVLEQVKKRNPGEAEFHQAVEEVLHSLEPVLEKHQTGIVYLVAVEVALLDEHVSSIV